MEVNNLKYCHTFRLNVVNVILFELIHHIFRSVIYFAWKSIVPEYEKVHVSRNEIEVLTAFII